LVLIRRRRWAPAALAVAASLIGDAGAQERPRTTTSIWDGVFTVEQARRGQTAYTGPCDRCHGYKLDGASDDPDMLPAPPVAGPKFLRTWEGRSLGALFEYTRATMPANNPGFLTTQELADVIAYMLLVSGVPAGDVELGPEPRDFAPITIISARPGGVRARAGPFHRPALNQTRAHVVVERAQRGRAHGDESTRACNGQKPLTHGGS
jgi:mono/diheme cytochrome c family protein